MIETRGLVSCIEAADSATKAAEVHLLGLEVVTGGLVMVRFVGDTSSVNAAVEAGSAAASRVGMLVSTRVISRLDDQVVRMLGITDPDPVPLATTQGPTTEVKAKAENLDATGRSDEVRGASIEIQSLSSSELRAMARAIDDFPVKGRELNRMSKEDLTRELLRIQTRGKGHE